MPKTFSSDDYCKFLLKHGFTVTGNKGTSHQKYKPPKSLKIPQGVRPFVVVVLNRKSYDPITASKIRKQLIKLGLSLETVKDLFK